MSHQRTALVTGASTGIGRATALELARRGFAVLAGVRKPEDGEALQTSATGELEPVIIDVTDAASIEAAAAKVGEQAGGGLAGLVNNAGIAYTGPLEFVALDDLRHQLEVNLIGQLAVTQAMLPELRAASGRIVNVTSIGGLVATPFFGPYVASKFALEAVSDCLRIELRPWGIETIAIEPGSAATEIWDSGQAIADETRARMGAEAERLYGAALDQTQRISAATGARGIPPEEVARVIHKALTVRRPRARYTVGRDAVGMKFASRLLPDRLWDRIVARSLKLP
ncbi:MAG: SDR family oxidoreductase [Thermoleophilia bacterium]|nr:SDR family oxidoreductase [Thermoleophilia bacterium]